MADASNINWKAVSSWLRKEASEHLKRADAQSRIGQQQSDSFQTADVFMGLARAIDYGIETQELAEAKDRIFRETNIRP